MSIFHLRLKRVEVFSMFFILLLLFSGSSSQASAAQQKNASDLKKEGIELYHSGDYSRAIEAFKQIESLTQDKALLAQAYIYLSMSYYCLEEQEESKKWLKKAVETNPEINEADLLFPPGFDTLYNETKGAPSKSPQAKVADTAKVKAADTASGTGGTKKKASALRVKLYGGYSRLSPGDVNEFTSGAFINAEFWANYNGYPISGSFSPLNSGINFGADVVYQLTPKIGVGIGAGYLQSSKTSEWTIDNLGGGQSIESFTPKLSAMPIRLALFLTFPLGGKLSLTADAGAAVYTGLKFEYRQRYEQTYSYTQTVKANRTSLSGNLGFQGSLGIDYAFTQSMGFFIEAVARYARFKNFDQDMAKYTYEDSFGGSNRYAGKIYMIAYTDSYYALSFTTFQVFTSPPTDSPPSYVYREPKFDLSGISLQAGIRIRF